MLLRLEKSDADGRSNEFMNDNEEMIDGVSMKRLGENLASQVASGCCSRVAQITTIYSLDEHIF